MEQLIFNQLQLNRARTLEAAAVVTEEEADIVPAGFNNNIRWQLGHILTTQERLSFRLIGEPLGLPEELTSLFVNGTKPAEWAASPPDLDTLRRLLVEQPGRIRERLTGRMEEKLTVPFKELGSLQEALIFSIGHEAMHAGFLKALHRATAAER